MSTLREDHKEIASGKQKDDEGYMARNELDSIERSVNNLKKLIKSSDTQLPAWVQSKITKAADYINTVAEYLESDEEVSEACWSGYKQVGMKKKGKKMVPNCVPVNEADLKINPEEHKKAQKAQKIRNLAQKGATEGERSAAERKTKGPKLFGENSKLVDKILEECGCNSAVCNNTPAGKMCPKHGMKDCSMKEEKDPKGPVQPYKSPKEIAKKHGVSIELIKKQLQMGIKVEGEHTSDKTAARITALQHLDEVPDYYSKLKEVEKKSTKLENVEIEDMFGNKFIEFIDLINPEPIYLGKTISESTRISATTGNLIMVILSWRGKNYSLKVFFPQAKLPTRKEIQSEIEKIYPDGRVIYSRVSEQDPGQSFLYAGGDAGKFGPNKNYVKTMGEEIDFSEDWQKVNRQDKTDGLSQKAVNAYRRENPGSKLQTAVTEKNPTGKRAERRKSFCKRMKGMKSKLTSAETSRDPDSRINKALRRWNCN